MLKQQVIDPTKSQKMLQTIGIITSALLSLTMTLLMENVFNIGVCEPISCWLQDKESSWGDDILLCYMMVFIPYVVWNFHQITNIKGHAMSQVLKPYVERMNVCIAICVSSIMFETNCIVMEVLITDFRNTRLARSLNMILNLVALLLQTFVVVIDFNQDFVEGIKRHTLYPLKRTLGLKVP